MTERVSRIRLRTVVTPSAETTTRLVVCPVDAPASDRRADFGEMTARTCLRDIVRPIVTCVTADLPVRRLQEILGSTSQRAVAVIDEEERLIGLVSRSDLLDADTSGTAADVMAPRVHALPEDAPLSYAISLLAYEDIGEVPLVAADGTVTGLCHATDILRWCAQRLGYAELAPRRAGLAPR